MKIQRDALKIMGLVAFVLMLVILAVYGIDKLDDRILKEEQQRAEVGYQREKDDTAMKKALTGNPCSNVCGADPIPKRSRGYLRSHGKQDRLE